MTQEQANQIIFDKSLVESEIASSIGVSPQALNYQLHKAKNFDKEVERRMLHYFEKQGVHKSEISLNDKLKIKMMLDEIRSEFNSKLDQLEEFVG